MTMTAYATSYSERKRALGLPETAIDKDHGFGHDDTKEYPRTYLSYKTTPRIKPPTLNEDFSKLKGGQINASDRGKAFWLNMTPKRKAEIMAKRRATRARKFAAHQL